MMRLIWKLGAFIRRDLATDVSYRLSFVLEVAHVAIAVAAFFYVSKLVGATRVQGYAPFAFILVGMAVNAYMTTCFVCFAQTIRGSQLGGTLKAVLATPTTPAEFLLGSSIYPFLRASIDTAVYLAAGIVFGLAASNANLLAAALVFVLSLLAFSSIGVVSASVTLMFKRGESLLWLFASGSWLLGGILYPIELLPAPLQRSAALLPITHAANGMRGALLAGASPLALWPDLRALVLFALVGFPLSLALFNLAIQRARREGTLGHQ